MPPRLRVLCLALGALWVVAASPPPLVAQVIAPPAGQPQTLSRGQIDTRLSRVFIRVGKTGLGHEHGVEGRLKTGSLNLEAATDAGQIVFDIPTFQADTPAAREHVGLTGTTDADTRRQVGASMLGARVLDAQHFPTATFRVHSIQPVRGEAADAAPEYQLEGDFTLHGATRKIKVVAQTTPATGFVHLHGKFTILQTDYGITPYSKAFGTIGVADSLTIWGDLWISSGPEAPR